MSADPDHDEIARRAALMNLVESLIALYEIAANDMDDLRSDVYKVNSQQMIVQDLNRFFNSIEMTVQPSNELERLVPIQITPTLKALLEAMAYFSPGGKISERNVQILDGSSAKIDEILLALMGVRDAVDNNNSFSQYIQKFIDDLDVLDSATKAKLGIDEGSELNDMSLAVEAMKRKMKNNPNFCHNPEMARLLASEILQIQAQIADARKNSSGEILGIINKLGEKVDQMYSSVLPSTEPSLYNIADIYYKDELMKIHPEGIFCAWC